MNAAKGSTQQRTVLRRRGAVGETR